MSTRVLVGLGSNLGDRRELLRNAVDRIRSLGTVVGMSSLYETDPIGGPEQDSFLNAVAVVDTDLTARIFLDELLTIERDLGRIRRERWGPRSIDLDLLAFGTETIDEPGLTVPHPRLTERRFVLEPLLEAFPSVKIPGVPDLRASLATVSDQEVHRLESSGVKMLRRAMWITIGGLAVISLAIGILGS
jgi:2-amino-4-hydroxy-6-hydroxymethyldihydropteridine diphosphokinase